MIGFPYDAGEYLSEEEAFRNLSRHGKKVAYTLAWFTLSTTVAGATDIPGPAPSPSSLGGFANKEFLCFLLGSAIVGLCT